MSFDPTDIDPDIMGGGGGQTPQDAKEANEQGNKIAQAVGQNAAGVANAEAGEMVKEFQKVWGPHYAGLQHERLKKINELAAQSAYNVSLNVPTGGEFINPITGKKEQEMSERWEHKTFKRQKLNQANWVAIEELKAKLAELDDPLEKVKLYNKIQESQAFLYLGMKPEDYRRCDWEEMSVIITACTHRTRHGLPNSATSSSNSSIQGGHG